MKTVNTLVVYFSFFLMTSLLASCEDESDVSDNSFLIPVDSILVPDNLKVNEAFDVSFQGTIGNNGCYHFSRFEAEKTGNTITVKAWGKVDNNSDVCATVMVYLDNEKLNLLIKEKGTYTIRVKQPGNSFLEKQILVE